MKKWHDTKNRPLYGNLTNDGFRSFTYDDENQLISVVVTNGSGSLTRSDFLYDGLLRRRVRVELLWIGGAWATNQVVRYVYDGALPLQERDANNLPLVTYTRGQDVSGSLDAAGGIGGLLARSDDSQMNAMLPGAHSYYHADGNGNVTCLINTNQSIVARYLYDPYGNLLSKSGGLADANMYRFSSKELHQNSGMMQFGYRFYDPSLQRWLNRDPIGEPASINLFEFVANTPVNRFDALGLCDDCPSIDAWPRSSLDWLNKGAGKEIGCEAKETGCITECAERFFTGKCAQLYEGCIAFCHQKKLECDLASSSRRAEPPPVVPKFNSNPPLKWWQSIWRGAQNLLGALAGA